MQVCTGLSPWKADPCNNNISWFSFYSLHSSLQIFSNSPGSHFMHKSSPYLWEVCHFHLIEKVYMFIFVYIQSEFVVHYHVNWWIRCFHCIFHDDIQVLTQWNAMLKRYLTVRFCRILGRKFMLSAERWLYHNYCNLFMEMQQKC